MKDLTPQERAAVIIRTLVNSTGLSMQALNLQSDLAISKMSENEQERLQQMVSSILYENIAAPSSEKGYSENWIEKRIRGIAVRDELTGEWKKRGVKEQLEFAILTAEISKATFGMTPSEYKDFKSLTNPKDNPETT